MTHYEKVRYVVDLMVAINKEDEVKDSIDCDIYSDSI